MEETSVPDLKELDVLYALSPHQIVSCTLEILYTFTLLLVAH